MHRGHIPKPNRRPGYADVCGRIGGGGETPEMPGKGFGFFDPGIRNANAHNREALYPFRMTFRQAWRLRARNCVIRLRSKPIMGGCANIRMYVGMGISYIRAYWGCQWPVLRRSGVRRALLHREYSRRAIAIRLAKFSICVAASAKTIRRYLRILGGDVVFTAPCDCGSRYMGLGALAGHRPLRGIALPGSQAERSRPAVETREAENMYLRDWMGPAREMPGGKRRAREAARRPPSCAMAEAQATKTIRPNWPKPAWDRRIKRADRGSGRRLLPRNILRPLTAEIPTYRYELSLQVYRGR